MLMREVNARDISNKSYSGDAWVLFQKKRKFCDLRFELTSVFAVIYELVLLSVCVLLIELLYSNSILIITVHMRIISKDLLWFCFVHQVWIVDLYHLLSVYKLKTWFDFLWVCLETPFFQFGSLTVAILRFWQFAHFPYIN